MKLYQFLLIFTFCSVFIKAYNINGDIPLPEDLRVNENKDKDDLCINTPWLKDKYVINCRYHHNEQKVYCDIKDEDELYVIIPIIEYSGKITKDDVTVTEWTVFKRVEISYNPFGGNDIKYNWIETNEIMETGSFESIEVGDNYHGYYFIRIDGNGISINLYYDRIVIGQH